MRLSLLLPCVVVGMIGVSLFAQTDDGLFPGSDETLLPTPDTTEEEASEDQKLRQQYLELIEQKSAHMDRSALREAISRAERDIDELKADAKLQEAKQLLLDLVKTLPETSAAQTARVMLQAEPGSRSILPEMLPQPYDPGDTSGFGAPLPERPDGDGSVKFRRVFDPESRTFQRVTPESSQQDVEEIEDGTFEPVRPNPRKRGSRGSLLPQPLFEDESESFDG